MCRMHCHIVCRLSRRCGRRRLRAGPGWATGSMHRRGARGRALEEPSSRRRCTSASAHKSRCNKYEIVNEMTSRSSTSLVLNPSEKSHILSTESPLTNSCPDVQYMKLSEDGKALYLKKASTSNLFPHLQRFFTLLSIGG